MTARILIEPVGATEILVRGGAELPAWRKAETCEVPGAQFTPHYRRGQWDGMYTPGRWCRAVGSGMWEMRCSRGLFDRLASHFQVAGTLPQEGWDTEEWAQVERLLSPEALGGRELRDYQADGVRDALRREWGRLSLATNAGKGAMIALIAEALYQVKDARTLVLADEIAVFEALVGEVESWGTMEVVRVESGIDEIPNVRMGQVAIAMVPTLSKRMKARKGSGDEGAKTAAGWIEWVRGFDCLLLDEADKASAESWKRILREAHRSRWRLGFSGTFPKEAHGRLVMDELMGPVIDRVRNMELVERGISARPRVELRGFACGDRLRADPVPAAEWWEMTPPERRRSVFERAIMTNPDRHAFVLSLIREDTPTCIIVNRIQHGEELAAHIPGSVFLSGSDTPSHRDETLTAFQDRAFNVLIVTRILDRGSNRLGHTMDLIFASGEGSNRQTLQRIGRGLRRGDGKEFLRLVDIVDRGHKYLASAARKRVELYNREGFEIKVHTERGLFG